MGVYTIDKFLDILEERKFTQRTAISHAFALLDVRPAEKEKLYQRGNASNGDYVYNSL